jgi:DNA-directed RNA polymerase subunit RPC12/RpoP
MSVVYRCQCGKKLVVNPKLIGRRVQCPQCGDTSVVPEQSTEATTLPSPTVNRPLAAPATPADVTLPRAAPPQEATPPRSNLTLVLVAGFALAGVLVACAGPLAIWFLFFRSTPTTATQESSASSDELSPWQKSRNRTAEANNLKQIGLALMNYHDSMGAFPAAAICDANGQPLLSWRVALLPYVEEGGLYNAIHLDEPWDSPHNRELARQMPKVYTCPYLGAEKGLTRYRGFTGDQAAFPNRTLQPGPFPRGRAITEFTDGTSNTLMVVVTEEAVPWMKPDELPYAPELPLPRLGSQPSGFQVLLVDGQVLYLKHSEVDDKTLRALITPNGGEIVDLKR